MQRGFVDLNIAINRILPGAKYRLSKSDPPHEVIEWRDVREQPTQAELGAAWNEYLKEEEDKVTLEETIKSEGKKCQVLDAEGSITEVYLLEVIAS